MDEKVALPDRVIFALLAIAVLAMQNADQKVPIGYFLSFEDERFTINDWWGRKNDFYRAIYERVQRMPRLTMNL
ncbi:hypothetical protein BIZ92_10515 [Achromobacter xylosoxidans]|uniref:Uncharacterized protein n=2 Tax=Alcaligenes xylosoxydans xylosoxydans TaxID=85698 RepID=A0A1R1JUJ1_ALCXX|nr:hypothetical protein BIZ92_10515 [Achromobacter xylosoxidans]